MLAQVRSVFGIGQLSQVEIIFVRRLAEAPQSLKSRGEIEVSFRPVLLLLRYGKAKLGFGCLVIAAQSSAQCPGCNAPPSSYLLTVGWQFDIPLSLLRRAAGRRVTGRENGEQAD